MLQSITQQLLESGADIREINTVRKRLSAVKGGKFALRCAPARVFSVVLSDVLGDPMDMIASGHAWPDSSTCAQAETVVRKYGISMPEEAMAFLSVETPKTLEHVEAQITGSVRELCAAAARKCAEQGIRIHDVLQKNDTYHALEKIGGLLITDPTGTNVNDVSVALYKTE